jgi:hypothetical protein
MVERISVSLPVSELEHTFYSIDFPEYQREPNVWSRDQKQRLIDSMLREFDISAIYLYIREDNEFECIDGRQRLNAIMSFLGENPVDDADNGFSLRFENEVTDAVPHPFADLNGRTFAELTARSDEKATSAVQAFRQYSLNVVQLAGFDDPDQFNLQFLRLNLGTLINAGEKLNAMVGRMHDELFESESIGLHPFFNSARIPTRRFAKELTAAQVVLQAFSFARTKGFSRARHYDLQRFVKENAEEIKDPRTLTEIAGTLAQLDSSFGDVSSQLRNRAITVTVILAAWDLKLFESPSGDTLTAFRSFVATFLGRLRWQVTKMKQFNVDVHWDYLVEFQRHLTQASVEKPAVTIRHEMMLAQFVHWLENGELQGDAEYRSDTGGEPPTAS